MLPADQPVRAFGYNRQCAIPCPRRGPDQIPAAYYGVSYAYAVNCELADGSRKVYFDLECGGWGAHPEEDGASAFSCGFHNIANAPVEMLESTLPLTFQEYGLVPDSGGAGKTRGGLGLAREFRVASPKGTLAANLDRFTHPPYGLNGGEPGKTGQLLLREASTGQVRNLASKVANLRIQQGDCIRLETAGGGGHGDASQRDPTAIAEDRKEGYISP